MIPKEKAKELARKFCSPFDSIIPNRTSIGSAIKCINEILEAIDWHQFETPNKEMNFWHDVKR